MFILPFMNQALAEQQMKQRVEWATHQANHFDEMPVPRKFRDVGIIAETYHPEDPLEAIFPNVPAVPHQEIEEAGVTDPTGTLRYLRQIFPYGNGLPIMAASSLYEDDARAFFTGDVIIPSLLHRSDPESKWKTWMGLAPIEMWSQRSGIRAATGTVLLGGLGMGWLLAQIAKKPSVKRIVVVERDRNLLEWFGYRLCQSFPKVEKVICDDVFEIVQDYPNGTRYVLDIWPEFGDARYDPRLEALREVRHYVWAWGSPRGGRDG